MEEILMSNETNVTVVPESEAPKTNGRARYMAYMQCVRKLELDAKAQKESREKAARMGGVAV